MVSKSSSVIGHIKVKDTDYNLNDTEKSKWLGHYRDSGATKDLPLPLTEGKGLIEWSADCLMALCGAVR